MPTTRTSSNMTTMQDNSEQENLSTTMQTPVIGDIFNFFDLPPELRNRIYGFCTGTVKVSKKYSSLSDTQKAGQVTHQAWPQLKLVSKDLKQEYEAQMVLEQRYSTLIVQHDPDDATVRWNIPLHSPRSSCHLSSGYLDMLSTITRLELSFDALDVMQADARPLLQSLPRLKHVKLNMYDHALVSRILLYEDPYHFTAEYVDERLQETVGDIFSIVPPRYEIDCVVTYTCLRASPLAELGDSVDLEEETWDYITAWEGLMYSSPLLSRMQVRGKLSDSPDAVDGMELEILGSTEEEAAFQTLQSIFDDAFKHYMAGRLTSDQLFQAAEEGSFEDILREAGYKRDLASGIISAFGGISPSDLRSVP